MFKINLYFKYLKYCIFKKPLRAISITTGKPDMLYELDSLKYKIYQLQYPNGKTVNCILEKYNYYPDEIPFEHYDIKYKFVWNIIGYLNNKPVNNCNWNEFK